MFQIPLWKKVLVGIVLVWGAFLALPNFLSDTAVENLPSFLPHHRFNLGLDLKGGSQLLLEVDLSKGLEDRMVSFADDVRRKLRKANIGYADMRHKETHISFTLRHPEKAKELQKIIREMDPYVQIDIASDTQVVTLTLGDEKVRERQKMMLHQTRDIVERRIDAYGTAEPTILIQGHDRILVQLPGIKEPGRIKELLGTTAKMTFHMVTNHEGSDTISLPLRDRRGNGESVKVPIEKTHQFGGENLISARAQTSSDTGEWVVAFELDSAGASKFAEITRNNVGRQFAIVLDNEIITAPVINGPIPGGSGVITGHFTSESAHDLALLMRSGALPAPLKIIEERVVGPDLGQDSITAGQRATVLSVLLIAVFMVVAYMWLGVIANIGLVANLILLFGGLSLLGATLTLPGIAGIALTLGMAVDANVLIYERIREEIRLGRKFHQALESGYTRAMTTIIDSNLTTVLVAGVLFYYGSGPVQGFAVTLTLGILISMFTAISLTKLIIVSWVNWRKLKTFNM